MAPVSCDRIISLVAANREIRNEFWVATLEYKLKDFFSDDIWFHHNAIVEMQSARHLHFLLTSEGH
jgi:hypothetical protein